jgi:hypothetical protein
MSQKDDKQESNARQGKSPTAMRSPAAVSEVEVTPAPAPLHVKTS